MKEDARAHPRYEIDAPVELAEVGTRRSGRAENRLQNISLGGICIQTSSVEEIGAPVDVVLHLDAAGASLDLRGQVVWVNREPPVDVGIRWTALDDSRRTALAEFIERVRRETTEIGA
jgi:hypothetical protein